MVVEWPAVFADLAFQIDTSGIECRGRKGRAREGERERVREPERQGEIGRRKERGREGGREGSATQARV